MNMTTEDLYAIPVQAALKAAKESLGTSWKSLADAIGVPASTLGHAHCPVHAGKRVAVAMLHDVADMAGVARESLYDPSTVGPRKRRGGFSKAKEGAGVLSGVEIEARTGIRPGVGWLGKGASKTTRPSPRGGGGSLQDALITIDDVSDKLAEVRSLLSQKGAATAERYRELVATFSPEKALSHAEAVAMLRTVVSDAKRFQNMRSLLGN